MFDRGWLISGWLRIGVVACTVAAVAVWIGLPKPEFQWDGNRPRVIEKFHWDGVGPGTIESERPGSLIDSGKRDK